MTKEQEEAIEYLEESVLIYKNTIPKISKSIETILSMLKEKDKEIERLEKVLEERYLYVPGMRTVYARLMCLEKEDIVKDDLSLRNEIQQHINEKEEKDKIIDLMAEQIKIPEPTMKIESFDIKPKTKFSMRYLNKEEVKQYFERKNEE